MIKVTDKYFILSDSYSYSVCTPYKSKGETVYKPLSYHGELHGALENIMRRLQRDYVANNDVSLGETLKHFKTLNREFSDMLFDFVAKCEHLPEVKND